MNKLTLILALALVTTPAFARPGGGSVHPGGIHSGRSVGYGYHGYRHVYRGGGYGYGYNGYNGDNGYNCYNGYNGYYGGNPGPAIGLGILGGVLGGIP
jgi:hypothetical protein